MREATARGGGHRMKALGRSGCYGNTGHKQALVSSVVRCCETHPTRHGVAHMLVSFTGDACVDIYA